VNPPEGLADDLPGAVIADLGWLVRAVFRFEQFYVSIFAEACDREPALFMGSNDDFSIETIDCCLRIIDGNNVSVIDEGEHGASLYTKATGVKGVRIPVRGGGDELLSGETGEVSNPVSVFMRPGSLDVMDRYCEELRGLGMGFPSAARRHNFNRQRRGQSLTGTLWDETEDVRFPESGPFPEEPAVGFSGEVSKLDIDLCGGLESATLPTRDSHGRVAEPCSKSSLAEAHAHSKLSNSVSPLRQL
jgi:hypothetical protein